MSEEERMERLDVIANELFIMANSFAGQIGSVATYIHESVNNIWDAQKIFQGETKDEIPKRLIMRSMGYREDMVSFDEIFEEYKDG